MADRRQPLRGAYRFEPHSRRQRTTRGQFTSAAAEAARSPSAETGPALATPPVWAEGEEAAETGPALAAPAVWAEGEEVSATGVRLHKPDHHRRRGLAAQQLAGEPPACTIQ